MCISRSYPTQSTRHRLIEPTCLRRGRDRSSIPRLFSVLYVVLSNKQQVYGERRAIVRIVPIARCAKRRHRLGFLGVSQRRPRRTTEDNEEILRKKKGEKNIRKQYDLRNYLPSSLGCTRTHARGELRAEAFLVLRRSGSPSTQRRRSTRRHRARDRFRAWYVNDCEQSDQRLTPEKGTERQI